jgi:hypothetical protein
MKELSGMNDDTRQPVHGILSVIEFTHMHVVIMAVLLPTKSLVL